VVALVSEYIVKSATFAPGARAAECAAAMGLSLAAAGQVSGSSQMNEYTRLA
jgi:hypothetical protein